MAIKNNSAKMSRCFLARGAMVLSAVVALGLGGCGYGDVEFKGKVFDAIGMNGTSQKRVTKMAPRAGLVTPPSLGRLPAPGEKPPVNDALASINDPDRKIHEDPAILAARQKAYCAKHYDPAVMSGDASADSIEGPAGLCRKSVLTSIQKWTGTDPAENPNQN